jgi:AcrR family transcriptional regulator
VRRRTQEPAPTRRRRSPEEARAAILDAAERVFGRSLPDVVGLKDVAREAGVSHALVTHYFGTYAQLVEATLERKITRARDALIAELLGILDVENKDVGVMLAAYRRAVGRTLQDQVTVRLAMWALLSGRVNEEDFVTYRIQGLKLLADALEAKSGLSRDDLEFCLAVSFALTVAWSLGRGSLSGAFGRRPSKERDADLEAKTAAMIESYLRAAKKRG